MSCLSASICAFASFRSDSFAPRAISCPLARPAKKPAAAPRAATITSNITTNTGLSNIRSMVSRRQEHINPRIHIHSQDRPHATRSVFGGRVDCGRIHRHLGVVAAVSKLGRTPGDSAADGRRICRPIPHNRQWSDDRRQSDGRRRIGIRHRRTTHRPPRQAPRHRAYPDHSNVRHHITGAGQNRHAGLADESVAARHRHHAGHVLLRISRSSAWSRRFRWLARLSGNTR